jgi:UDP-GlcNAc:undecaprenyl-phosphate GlcNAc-1-phosphate transferase
VKLNIVDIPTKRKVHLVPIPRMGGIIIYASLLLSIFLFIKDINAFRPIIIGSFLLVFTGIYDDVKGLSWKYKFIAQFIAAAILIDYFLPYFHEIKLFEFVIPYPVGLVILLLFIVGTINSINLMDGLDGLVTGFSFQIFLLAAIIGATTNRFDLLIVSVALLGGTIGFLKYNSFPASIFLGDTGSLMLGFFILYAILRLSLILIPGTLDLTIPAIALCLPIIDTLRVMTVRLVNGKNPFLPDKGHLHHIIMGIKIRHQVTVVIIQLYTALFASLALVYEAYSRSLALVMVFLLVMPLLFTEKILKTFVGKKLKTIVQAKTVRSIGSFSLLIKKLFIPLSFLTFGLFLIPIFPLNSLIDRRILGILLLFIVIFFLVSYFRRNDSRGAKDIYVLINIAVFIYCSNNASHLITYFHFLHDISTYIRFISLSGLILFILIALTHRQFTFEIKRTFLSGFDFILIILAGTIIILNIFLPYGKINFIEINLLELIVIYFWYKTVLFYNNSIKKVLFYGSFALPCVALVYLLL